MRGLSLSGCKCTRPIIERARAWLSSGIVQHYCMLSPSSPSRMEDHRPHLGHACPWAHAHYRASEARLRYCSSVAHALAHATGTAVGPSSWSCTAGQPNQPSRAWSGPVPPTSDRVRSDSVPCAPCAHAHRTRLSQCLRFLLITVTRQLLYLFAVALQSDSHTPSATSHSDRLGD